ncbi:MAG: hypothetical protein EOP49_28920 [Sphingobacteriales bacterium]|nr:MAG: hypothetical protein EOP49_28920 [Sphingobacteriales bacterium]
MKKMMMMMPQQLPGKRMEMLRRIASADFYAIERKLLRQAAAFLSEIDPYLINQLLPSDIFPSLFGTIHLDWQSGNKLLSIELLDTHLTYYLEVDNKAQLFEKVASITAFIPVSAQLSSLLYYQQMQES